VSRLLADLGLTVVEPEVGELVTSLDMAGCSLTVVFLDDELERLWCAAADTPAYRKRAAARTEQTTRRAVIRATSEATSKAVTRGTPESQACARSVVRALESMSTAVHEAEAELGRIDAVAGDGDHGRGMVKGVDAAVAAANGAAGGAGAGSTLTAAGGAFAAEAGGTSGVLWGAVLVAIGGCWGDDVAPADADIVRGLTDGLDSLCQLGGARLGDKTMVDAYVPFVDALRIEIGNVAGLPGAWGIARLASRPHVIRSP